MVGRNSDIPITAINDAWIHDPKKKAEVEAYILLGRSGTAKEMGEISTFLML